MPNILIVDDDGMLCETFCRHFRYLGHHAVFALTLEQGLQRAHAEPFDIIFLDVRLPDGNGLHALPGFHESYSRPEIIIITGVGDPEGAELAIQSGAWDYIEKPLSIKKVNLQLVRTLQYREEKSTRKPAKALKLNGLIGGSPQMRACFDLLAQAGNSDMSVLIIGETGTGKELFARAVHENSARSNRNFVVVDCAALPETLVESVLFGHRKGAYTGADRDQEGLVKQADNGTLFLDEVGELPPPVQKAFLRVLQEHRFRPLGAKVEEKSDFRLVAATNKDLDKMRVTGQFRADLLFRLRGLTIELPRLRERTRDIKELILHYLIRLCEQNRIETKGISPDFFEKVEKYPWPGNVRELIHALETAVAAARYEPTLFSRHLPMHIRVHAAKTSVVPKIPAIQVIDEPLPAPNTLKALPSLKAYRKKASAEAEKKYLTDLVELTGNNVKEACRISGLSRSRLYELLKTHKISSPA